MPLLLLCIVPLICPHVRAPYLCAPMRAYMLFLPEPHSGPPLTLGPPPYAYAPYLCQGATVLSYVLARHLYISKIGRTESLWRLALNCMYGLIWMYFA